MIETRLYYMKEVGDILEKYCLRNNVSQSEFVRHSVLLNMDNKETLEKLKKRSYYLKKRMEIRWQSESLKYQMSRVFFGMNSAKKLAQAIQCCDDKNILLALLEEYIEIAKLTENNSVVMMLEKMKTGLKSDKEYKAVRAEFRDYIVEKNSMFVERRIKR